MGKKKTDNSPTCPNGTFTIKNIQTVFIALFFFPRPEPLSGKNI